MVAPSTSFPVSAKPATGGRGYVTGCRGRSCSGLPVAAGAELCDCLVRRVMTGRAHDAATRPRARTAKEQSADRSLIFLRARHRPHVEGLLRHQLALENVTAGQAEAILDIRRREHLPGDH